MRSTFEERVFVWGDMFSEGKMKLQENKPKACGGGGASPLKKQNREREREREIEIQFL